jgi:hypothetical protein
VRAAERRNTQQNNLSWSDSSCNGRDNDRINWQSACISSIRTQPPPPPCLLNPPMPLPLPPPPAACQHTARRRPTWRWPVPVVARISRASSRRRCRHRDRPPLRRSWLGTSSERAEQCACVIGQLLDGTHGVSEHASGLIFGVHCATLGRLSTCAFHATASREQGERLTKRSRRVGWVWPVTRRSRRGR